MSEFADFLAFHFERQRADLRAWFRWAAFMYRWQTSRWFFELLDNMEGIAMARGKGRQAAPISRSKAGSVWFVNVAVAVADEGKIADFLPTADAVYDGMMELMMAGYRIGFNYDMQRDAVIASLTCRDDKSANHNGVLNAFAGDWFTALRVVMYKHYVILNEDWTAAETGAARPAFG